MKAGADLISPYFPEAWTGIAALTITDSVSFGLKNLQLAVCEEDTYDQNSKTSTPLSFIPSTYYHYFHTTLAPSKDLTRPCILFFITQILFLSSLFSVRLCLTSFWCFSLSAKFSKGQAFIWIIWIKRYYVKSEYLVLFHRPVHRALIMSFKTITLAFNNILSEVKQAPSVCFTL